MSGTQLYACHASHGTQATINLCLTSNLCEIHSPCPFAGDYKRQDVYSACGVSAAGGGIVHQCWHASGQCGPSSGQGWRSGAARQPCCKCSADCSIAHRSRRPGKKSGAVSMVALPTKFVYCCVLAAGHLAQIKQPIMQQLEMCVLYVMAAKKVSVLLCTYRPAATCHTSRSAQRT